MTVSGILVAVACHAAAYFKPRLPPRNGSGSTLVAKLRHALGRSRAISQSETCGRLGDAGRKPCHNSELRVGRFRVSFDVDEAVGTVQIVAVGQKVHNRLYIGNEEIELGKRCNWKTRR